MSCEGTICDDSFGTGLAISTFPMPLQRWYQIELSFPLRSEQVESTSVPLLARYLSSFNSINLASCALSGVELKTLGDPRVATGVARVVMMLVSSLNAEST